MSECFVSAKDIRIHWQNEIAVSQSGLPPIWSGDERRIGPEDRRAVGHERRWEGSRGRRFRLQDRRKR